MINKLKPLLEKENITKVADDVELSRTLVSKLANLDQLPENTKVSTLLKLTEYFEIPMSALFNNYSLTEIYFENKIFKAKLKKIQKIVGDIDDQ